MFPFDDVIMGTNSPASWHAAAGQGRNCWQQASVIGHVCYDWWTSDDAMIIMETLFALLAFRDVKPPVNVPCDAHVTQL